MTSKLFGFQISYVVQICIILHQTFAKVQRVGIRCRKANLAIVRVTVCPGPLSRAFRNSSNLCVTHMVECEKA
jgi:hypothetical protein